MQTTEKPKYEYILLAIDDQIGLINGANEAIKRHQNDSLQVAQYSELKEQYSHELQELLTKIFEEYDIPLITFYDRVSFL